MADALAWAVEGHLSCRYDMDFLRWTRHYWPLNIKTHKQYKNCVSKPSVPSNNELDESVCILPCCVSEDVLEELLPNRPRTVNKT
jgi:hypothetical protein